MHLFGDCNRMPIARVVERSGGYYLEVNGMSESIQVVRKE
jgi:hypothetical protein